MAERSGGRRPGAQAQGGLLTLLLLHPDTEYTLSEVAGKLGLPLTTVQREAGRLADSGLIKERRVGRSRLVSANPASRYTRARQAPLRTTSTCS